MYPCRSRRRRPLAIARRLLLRQRRHRRRSSPSDWTLVGRPLSPNPFRGLRRKDRVRARILPRGTGSTPTLSWQEPLREPWPDAQRMRRTWINSLSSLRRRPGLRLPRRSHRRMPRPQQQSTALWRRRRWRRRSPLDTRSSAVRRHRRRLREARPRREDARSAWTDPEAGHARAPSLSLHQVFIYICTHSFVTL